MPSDREVSEGKYGSRLDGTPKGDGWLGPIKSTSGDTMTELSMDFDYDGKRVLAPLLVPTLTEEEIGYLSSGNKPTKGIIDKAISHAIERVGKGKSPFKD